MEQSPLTLECTICFSSDWLQMWDLYSFFFIIIFSLSISCWEHTPTHAHMHACEKHTLKHTHTSGIMKHFLGGLVTEEVSRRSFSHFSFWWKLVLRTPHPLWTQKLNWLEWMKMLNRISKLSRQYYIPWIVSWTIVKFNYIATEWSTSSAYKYVFTLCRDLITKVELCLVIKVWA